MTKIIKNNKKLLNRKNTREIIRFFFLFAFIFGMLFVIMNFENFSHSLQYTLEQILPRRIEVIGEAAMTKISQAKPKPQVDSILIPKTGISAPIVLPKSENEKDILLALKKGVVFYPSFSRPGEKGMTVISGHSSPHLLYRGEYNTVFSLLGKLTKGDEIIIYYKNNKYIYKVTNQYTVLPEKELREQTERSLLLLITCWPPGTDFKRIVIEAELSP